MRRIGCLLLLCSLLTGMLCGCSGSIPEKLRSIFVTDEIQTEDPNVQPQDTTVPVALQVKEERTNFGLCYQKQFGLHPYHCMSLNNRMVLSFLYESLFVADEQFSAKPVLAESYSVSEDGFTTVIKLKPGIRFHSGKALTAQDAAYSILSSMGTEYYKNRLRNVSKVEAVDELTLNVTCIQIYECLPLLLDMAIIADGSVEDAVPDGTGPYVLSSEEMLTRFDGWWQEDALVSAKEIPLSAADTTVDVRDRFEYSGVNMVLTDPNSAAYASFHNDYELWSANTTVMQYIGYNLSSTVFSNYGLRSAITYAVDRESLVTEQANGFAVPAVLPCFPSSTMYDYKLANAYDYDVRDYWKQLENAGVRDMDGNGTLDLYVQSLGYAVPVSGRMIVCSNSYQRVNTAAAIVEKLNSLGFDITLEAMDLQEYQTALLYGNFDLYFGEVRLSPNFDLSPFFALYGALAYGDLADSTMLNLCNMTLLNRGNSYSLYKRLCSRGYLTPVLFKVNALYTTRGSIKEPAQYLDWFVPAEKPTEQ